MLEVTVRFIGLEAPPPGPGLVILTGYDPAVATSVARTATLLWVDPVPLIVLLKPLNVAVAPVTKFDPFTVKLKAPLPAVLEDGDRLIIDGNGLFTVNVLATEVPPEVVTVIERCPAVAISDWGIEAIN